MRSTITSGRAALATSVLALVVALSGVAYAANTVRSADIVDGAVQSRDIGSRQVRNADLGTGAVTSAKLAAGAVTSAKIADGSVGNADLATGAVDSFTVEDGTLIPGDMSSNGLGRSPRLFARIASGLVVGGLGVTGLDNPSAGVYSIGWDRDVDTCALLVTPEGASRVASASSADATVAVSIVDRSTGAAVNTDFSILIVC